MIKIKEEDIANFESDGVLKIEAAVSARQTEDLDRAISPYLPRRKLLNKILFGDSLFFTQPNVWMSNPYFLQFVQQPNFIHIASQLLRSTRINLLQDMIFVKSENCKQIFDWHTDVSYAPIDGKKIISFWMATEKVSLDDGGLQFIKGSHRWTKIPDSRPSLVLLSRFLPQNWGKGQSRESVAKEWKKTDQFSEDDIVSFNLDRGDILAFHGTIQHRSGPNWSGKINRKGYAIRYAGDDITYKPHSKVGIAYQLWDPKLSIGEKMGGSVFPMIYENGDHIKLESANEERGKIWRLIRSQILSFRSMFADI